MRTLLALIQLLVADRQRLMIENLALRHQLAVLKRSVKRPRIEDSDRMLWILLRRAFKEWRDTVIFVKPDTVVRWHRRGFRYYWKRKSRSRPGRPPISMELIHLIRRMSTENPTWGFFVVPTATFKLLYVFVVLSHGRRRILQCNAREHPTAAWTARQILEAFPAELPRLLHDRDRIYGWEFDRMVRALGIRQIRSAPRYSRAAFRAPVSPSRHRLEGGGLPGT